VQFNFLDEETLLPVINVTFDVFSTVFSNTFTTGAGNDFFLTNLPEGDYQIRYNIENGSRTKRSYFLRIPHTTSSQVNITMLSILSSEATLFLRRVVDQGSIPLENSLLEIQRPYPSDDNTTFIFRTVEITNIDSQGDAVFSAIANTQAYRFRVLTNFQIVSTKAPTFLVDVSSEIIAEEDISPMTGFTNSQNISFIPIIYQNSTQFFVFDYIANVPLDLICLNLNSVFGITSTSTSTCSSSSSGTLALSAPNTFNGTYTATATYSIDDELFILDVDVQNFARDRLQENNPFAFTGALLYLLTLILAGSLGFFVNPTVAVVYAIATTAAFGLGFLGLFTYELISLGGLLVVGIIILFLLKKR